MPLLLRGGLHWFELLVWASFGAKGWVNCGAVFGALWCAVCGSMCGVLCGAMFGAVWCGVCGVVWCGVWCGVRYGVVCGVVCDVRCNARNPARGVAREGGGGYTRDLDKMDGSIDRFLSCVFLAGRRRPNHLAREVGRRHAKHPACLPHPPIAVLFQPSGV